MPYVSKDDIMAYIGAALSVQAGQPQQVQLILYKVKNSITRKT